MNKTVKSLIVLLLLSLLLMSCMLICYLITLGRLKEMENRLREIESEEIIICAEDRHNIPLADLSNKSDFPHGGKVQNSVAYKQGGNLRFIRPHATRRSTTKGGKHDETLRL